MKNYRKPLALLFVATLLQTVVSARVAAQASAAQRVDASHTQMTVCQAPKALAESLSHLGTVEGWSAGAFGGIKRVDLTGFDLQRVVKIDRHGLAFRDFKNPGGTRLTISFAGLKDLSVEPVPGNAAYLVRSGVAHGRNQNRFFIGVIAYFPNAHEAMMFVDAVLRLKEVEFTEEADFDAFTANAKTWLEAKSKPEMSDDARAYNALAEDAYKRKDLTAALDAYCNALDRYPMWPEGNFNAALLAAEAEDYGLAAQLMRRYLVLAPDAKDAAAAKEQFLLWQLKAKQ